MTINTPRLIALLLALAPTLCFAAPVEWIQTLASPDPEVREAAFNDAAAYDAEAIVPVAALLDKDDPAVRRAARIALESLVGAHLLDEDERKVTALALCRAALAVRDNGWLLRLLSYTGGEESVEPILVLIQRNNAGAEPARQTLDAILRARDISETGKARIVEVLRTQIDQAASIEKAGYLHTLGTVASENAVALLAQTLDDNPDPETRAAALKGLTDCLHLESARDVDVSDPSFDYQLHRAAYLNPGDAHDVYEDLLDDADLPGARTAAITGFGTTLENDRDARDLAAHLSFPRADVAGAARNALVAWEAPGADEDLMRLARRADGTERIGLLEVLTLRDKDRARPALEDATTNRDPVIRVAAWLFLGDPPPAEALEAYLEVAQGDSVMRLPAQVGLLDIADSTREAGEESAARDLYRKAVEFMDRPAERNRALNGIAALADPASLPVLETLEADGTPLDDLTPAYLAIAEAADDATATPIFRRVLTATADHVIANRAAARLRDRGIDEDFARNAGFVSAWEIVGPFPGNDFAAALPPEEQTDPQDTYDLSDGSTLAWKALKTTDVMGLVDLIEILGDHREVTAYARATVSVTEAADVLLKMGSDDGIVAWVNGAKVHANEANRPVIVDDDTKPATLQAGENTILLKIIQNRGGWGFCLRLTDRAGQPLAFTQ
jgi:hypothetical protein